MVREENRARWARKVTVISKLPLETFDETFECQKASQGGANSTDLRRTTLDHRVGQSATSLVTAREPKSQPPARATSHEIYRERMWLSLDAASRALPLPLRTMRPATSMRAKAAHRTVPPRGTPMHHVLWRCCNRSHRFRLCGPIPGNRPTARPSTTSQTARLCACQGWVSVAQACARERKERRHVSSCSRSRSCFQ